MRIGAKKSSSITYFTKLSFFFHPTFHPSSNLSLQEPPSCVNIQSSTDSSSSGTAIIHIYRSSSRSAPLQLTPLPSQFHPQPAQALAVQSSITFITYYRFHAMADAKTTFWLEDVIVMTRAFCGYVAPLFGLLRQSRWRLTTVGTYNKRLPTEMRKGQEAQLVITPYMRSFAVISLEVSYTPLI